LPSCCCKKTCFFFSVFSFVLLLLVCGFLQNLRCQAIQAIEGLSVYHLGVGIRVFFLANSTLVFGGGLNFFDFHPDPNGEMLKFD